MAWLVMGEFLSGDELLEAIRELRRAGHRDLDAYTPYPVEGMREALELPRSFVRYAAFVVGLGAAIAGYLVQWLCNAILYPINVGGRPLNAAPAFIPITYESMILFACFAIFGGLLVAWRLPNLHHAAFAADGFESVSTDGFWVSCAEEGEPGREAALRELRRLGARRVQALEEEEE